MPNISGLLVVTAVSVLTTAAAVALAGRGSRAAATSVIAPGLAAGVMLWLAAAEVGPLVVRDLGMVAGAGTMAAGAALVWLVSRLVDRTTVAAGIAPVLGVALVLHDVPEGFAVGSVVGAAGLAVSLPTVLAVAAHNLPEKLAFVAPATAEGRSRRAVLAAATLPEPAGAALAAGGTALAPSAVTVALALAGGMMAAVAIGALPEIARRAQAVRPFVTAGLVGAAGMALVGVVVPAA